MTGYLLIRLLIDSVLTIKQLGKYSKTLKWNPVSTSYLDKYYGKQERGSIEMKRLYVAYSFIFSINFNSHITDILDSNEN